MKWCDTQRYFMNQYSLFGIRHSIVFVFALLPASLVAQTDTTRVLPPSRSAPPLEYKIGEAIT